eukprot:sb/3477941/
MSDQRKGPKKKESILDLAPYLEKKMRVKFNGGREASGILKGYDALLNLVLDNATEYIRETEGESGTVTMRARQTGLVVCRGTNIVTISPQDGIEQIANPFVQQE